MGGDLSVKNNPDGGCTFTVWLMLSRVDDIQEEQIAPRKIYGYGGKKRSVMVVDDDATHRGLMSELLTPLDFGVVEAHDAEACLEMVADFTPDIFLIDRRMPGMNGPQLAIKLRQLGFKVPIVMVTANANEDTQAEDLAENQGLEDASIAYDDYLIKPIRLDGLLQSLAKYLDLEWIYTPNEAESISYDKDALKLDAEATKASGDALSFISESLSDDIIRNAEIGSLTELNAIAERLDNHSNTSPILPTEQALLQNTLISLYFILMIVFGVIAWLFILAHESREVAQQESNRQTQLLIDEIEAHSVTDQELQEAKELAVRANQAKSRYLTGISHELRTPLQSIYGYAQLLLDRQEASSDQNKGLTIIRRNSEHLAGLIEGLLDISKIEAGRLDIIRNRIRIPDLLEQIEQTFIPVAQEKGLEFNMTCADNLPRFVIADEKRLRQILINLLSNAFKYTEQGSVDFKISYRSQLMQFSVKDTGVGIEQADIQRILDPFERVRTASVPDVSGTGLGLTIVRLLTDIMGGELKISSTPGEGSEFIVSLLLLETAEQPQDNLQPSKISGYAGDTRTILVVDDEAVHRGLVADLLQPIGFRVLEATDANAALGMVANPDTPQIDLFLLDISMPGKDGFTLAVDDAPDSLSFISDVLEQEGISTLVALGGSQALSVAKRIKPDLILLDAIMPQMDGFETCRQLKAIPSLVSTPVMFMTGLSDTESIVKGLQAGGVDYLTKPVDPKELLARMEVHLANARLANSAQEALDSVGHNLIALNKQGDTIWATPETYSLLARVDANDTWLEQTFSPSIAKWLANNPEASSRLPLNAPAEKIELTILQHRDAEEALCKISTTTDEEHEGPQKLQDTLGLTKRESEVLYWLAQGKTNKEIAEILEIGARTVDKHLEQMFPKLGVENRTSAAGVAIRTMEASSR
eukprot:g16932.t1